MPSWRRALGWKTAWAVFDNDDVATYGLAQEVLRGEHGWMERGIVGG